MSSMFIKDYSSCFKLHNDHVFGAISLESNPNILSNVIDSLKFGLLYIDVYIFVYLLFKFLNLSTAESDLHCHSAGFLQQYINRDRNYILSFPAVY